MNKEYLYAIYDTCDNEMCIGIFERYKEAGERLGLSGSAIYRAIKRGSIINKQYIAKKIEKEELGV